MRRLRSTPGTAGGERPKERGEGLWRLRGDAPDAVAVPPVRIQALYVMGGISTVAAKRDEI